MAKEILRETNWFVAERTRTGVRISAKHSGVTPKSRVVSPQAWELLSSMSDDSFNGTVIMEIGVGTYAKQ